MRKHWIAAALAALATSQAFADEKSGLYVGAGLGDFSSEIQSLEDVDIDFDEDEDASKLFVGWRFNRFFALQLDYMDLGSSNTAVGLLDLNVDTKGYAPRAVGTLPIGPIELFASVGMLFYNLDVDLDVRELADESDNDPIYGVGIGVTLLERLALRLEYEQIDIDTFDDANAVWLSAAWRF